MTRRAPDWISRTNRWLYGVGIAVFALHAIHLSIYAVDIPFMDEWGGASFYPGLQQPELNWAFVFAPHNTHRIVPTRLEYWAFDHFADLNFATLALVNFGLFMGLAWGFLKVLERRSGVAQGAYLVVFATAALHENHYWGFGGQFHFVVGFFLLAVHAATSDGSARFASLPLIAGSMLSFGTGPVYGVALALCFLALAWLGVRRIESCVLAALTLALVGVWLWTTPIGSPRPTSPLSVRYWSYLFDLLASGFGYGASLPAVGAVLLLLLIGAAGLLVLSARRADTPRRLDAIALATVAVGLLGGLASTTLGRAHMNSPKTSRYVELGIFLVPVLWSMLVLAARSHAGVRAHPRAATTAAAVLALVLVAPFANDYDFKGTYEPLFHGKQATAACVRRFLFYGGSPNCPIPYRRDITRHMQAAREAGLLYTKKP